MKKKTQTNPAAEEELLAAAAAALVAEAEQASAGAPAGGESPQKGAMPVNAPDGVLPETGEGEAGEAAMAPDAGTPRSEAELLSLFLSSLSGVEREALTVALSRLVDAERMRAAEHELARENAALAEMERSHAFIGITERKEALDALCASVPWLRALPLYERLAAAYYIDRGARYGEPTREDLLTAVLSDKELLRELSLRRREAGELTARTLPPVGRTAGIGAAPATVKKSPRSLDEATGEAKRFLRFYK